MRMAYEQLDELAANAERVKFAIERNRSLLTLQVFPSSHSAGEEVEKKRQLTDMSFVKPDQNTKQGKYRCYMLHIQYHEGQEIHKERT